VSATADSDDVVLADGVSKHFGQQVALSGLTFSVPRNTIVGFIGPSGCGKTTLVRLLTGAYPPSEGDLLVRGRVPTRFTRRERQDIGYLPQLPVLFPELSVWENLNFHASLSGVRLRRRRRLFELLDFVELTGHRRKRVDALSGGMRRRAALAAALVHDPGLVFLDEPTAGIDPILRHKFWEQFRSLRDEGRTLVVTTQYISDAAFCDVVAVLSAGRLVSIASPDRLRRQAFGGDLVDLVTVEPQPDHVLHDLRDVTLVRDLPTRPDACTVRCVVDDAGEAVPALLQWAEAQAIPVTSCHRFEADFDDVFVELVERERASVAAAEASGP
jgi:ABC-2 type transport system ATP-binding protein